MKDIVKKIEGKYEAQALAIAMVVLVISSLIAISVYSRSTKDKGLTLEERASAEALEVSDLLLDKLTAFPITEVITILAEESELGVEDSLDFNKGIIVKEQSGSNGEGITNLFSRLGILEGTATISDMISPLCPVSEGSSNEYQITLLTADENTYYEIRPGQVWSLPSRAILLGRDDCMLNMKVAIRGDSKAGFSLIKSYCKYEEGTLNWQECRGYEGEDITNYCFGSAEECNNDSDFDDLGNWQKYQSETTLGPISMGPTTGVPVEEYQYPTEIRIKAVGGTIGISYKLPEQCVPDFRMFLIRATANCSGVYRGKEILIPEQKWHTTIFDYVFFNGEGSM
jgi:hypothetical protein